MFTRLCALQFFKYYLSRLNESVVCIHFWVIVVVCGNHYFITLQLNNFNEITTFF